MIRRPRNRSGFAQHQLLFGLLTLGGFALGFGITIALILLTTHRDLLVTNAPKPTTTSTPAQPTREPLTTSASTSRQAASEETSNTMQYSGFPAIPGLSAVQPRIYVSRSSGTGPAMVHVSACSSTMTHTGIANRFNAYEDLEFTWNFGDPTGTETFTNPVGHMPGQKKTVNANSDQTGPEACYVYRNPGTYTITLTARGRDENGRFVTAQTQTLISPSRYMVGSSTASGAGTLTFTVSVDGGPPQSTAALSWTSPVATIIAAIEGLSNVGAGNVRHTGAQNTDENDPYNSNHIDGLHCGRPLYISFLGSLDTHDVQLSVVSQVASGSVIGRRLPGSTGATAPAFTCAAFSGTSRYFDSNYDGAAGAADGTRDKPYPTCSGKILTGSNCRNLFKRGGTYPNSNPLWGVGVTNLQFVAYGDTGPKPELVNTNGMYAPSGWASDRVDWVFSNLVVSNHGPNDNPALFNHTCLGQLRSGLSAGYLPISAHVLYDNVEVGRIGTIDDGTTFISQDYNDQWFAVWGCDLRINSSSAVNTYVEHGLGWAYVGTIFGGGYRLVKHGHNIYHGNGDHFLARWLDFSHNSTDNGQMPSFFNNIKLFPCPAYNGEDSRYVLVSDCLMGYGAMCGVCLQGVVPALKISGLWDCAVIQNCHIHACGYTCGGAPYYPIDVWSAPAGIRVTARDSWVSAAGRYGDGTGDAGNAAIPFDVDVSNSFLKLYRNRIHVAMPTAGNNRTGPAISIGHGRGDYCCYNIIQKDSMPVIPNFTGVINLLRTDFSAGLWEVHDNQYYTVGGAGYLFGASGSSFYRSLDNMKAQNIDQGSVLLTSPPFVKPDTPPLEPGNLTLKNKQERRVSRLGGLTIDVDW